MSFSYLAQPESNPFQYLDNDDGQERPTGGIQFQLPDYLCDYAPPTLAPGGGAEALHPAQAAQWFANSGFDHRAQYPQYGARNLGSDDSDGSYPAVQDAYQSLESLQGAFPHPPNNNFHAYQQPHHSSAHPHWSLTLNASPPPDDPSPLTGAGAGLPVYSQSGFDIVSLIARVQNRINPKVRLGPVDFTTSFVVVDVRRYDDPIVYCSPSFCGLTGYAEREVLGRNCRFLQAPMANGGAQLPGGGVLPLAKGDPRRHTSGNAVRALAKAVGGRKEAQVSVVNYRKDGSAFVNLVSVVPLFGEFVDEEGPTAECVWFVGFQIDLTKQSEGIVERVREGRYYAGAVVAISQQQRHPSHNSTQQGQQQQQQQKPTEGGNGVGTQGQRERRSTVVPAPRMSSVLARLLTSTAFLNTCGLQPPLPNPTSTSAAGVGAGAGVGGGLQPDPTSHALHSLLLEQLPDFVHVLSLKGAFLYVAPAVTRVLGWAPAELVGRALADVCFSRDVVSVGRALKEASLPVEGVRIDGGENKEKEDKEKHKSTSNTNSSTSSPGGAPTALIPAEALRTVDLVFRARTKQGSWVWVECRGRLHVEPGKGRKAIVLVGRARGMAQVPPGTSLSGGVGELRVPGESYTSPSSTAPTSPTYPTAPTFHARSPTGSVSGLEFALQPKRARIEDTHTRGSSTTLRSPSPDTGGTSAAVPTAFHGILDPHGLLLSVGAGARALLGWDPLALRGTRLGALVAPDGRLSAAGAPSPVDALLTAWRVERKADPANAAAGAVREVRCTLQGRMGPVDAVVRVVAPLPEKTPLPPAVAPARLMYAVRRAGAAPVPRAATEDLFKRLDPATGGSWQYELQQLRFANARLEEEIVELERAERERAEVKEREREEARGRERERERVRMEQRTAYQQQQQAPPHWGYDQPTQWGYAPPPQPLTYQLPMKRAWDRRDEV